MKWVKKVLQNGAVFQSTTLNPCYKFLWYGCQWFFKFSSGGIHKVRTQVREEGHLTKSVHLLFYWRHIFVRGGAQIFGWFERTYFMDGHFSCHTFNIIIVIFSCILNFNYLIDSIKHEGPFFFYMNDLIEKYLQTKQENLCLLKLFHSG